MKTQCFIWMNVVVFLLFPRGGKQICWFVTENKNAQSFPGETVFSHKFPHYHVDPNFFAVIFFAIHYHRQQPPFPNGYPPKSTLWDPYRVYNWTIRARVNLVSIDPQFGHPTNSGHQREKSWFSLRAEISRPHNIPPQRLEKERIPMVRPQPLSGVLVDHQKSDVRSRKELKDIPPRVFPMMRRKTSNSCRQAMRRHLLPRLGIGDPRGLVLLAVVLVEGGPGKTMAEEMFREKFALFHFWFY